MKIARSRVIARSHYVEPPAIVRPHVSRGEIARLAEAPALAYEDLSRMVDRKEIESVEITRQSPRVKALTKEESTIEVDVPKDKTLEFISKLNRNDVPVYYKENAWSLNNIMTYSLEAMVVVAFGMMIAQMLRQRGNISDFSKISGDSEQTSEVTFDDVAGARNAKRSLQEIVDFLKNPEKFDRLGARVPKGALLVGPSGTGKTLLARAVAGEAGVPFFYASASEMIQMFVGVGASRVRSLFEKAKAKAPSIVFIDEIDAVGKARGGGLHPSNDEREQTVNQLLTEMDGFKGNAGVIVLAATNRADVLDPALVRAGRFDRQIAVDLPDFSDRVEILRVHARGKPLDAALDLSSVARATTGFSGADLANLANEAAIFAARRDKDSIDAEDFQHAMDVITLGDRRDVMTSQKTREITAYHEAGHAIVAIKLGLCEAVRVVSIIPRGKTGGVTILEPKEDEIDELLVTRETLENRIAVALGGRIAEEIAFGPSSVTTGAASDLRIVHSIARHMVAHCGLSEDLGPIDWLSIDGEISQKVLYRIDYEVIRLVDRIYANTKRLLEENRASLDALAESLVKKEVMTGEDVKKILGNSEVS